MDSPLTTAELSRLRKAINQRERLLSQGLSVSTAESNIARALSNLKIFLSQSQVKLAAALKDWEGADQTTKTQIVLWLKQDILGEQTSVIEASTPISRTQSSTPQAAFVAPPPPPPLPAKVQSLPPQSQFTSHSYGQNTSTSTLNVSARSASPRPLPAPNAAPLKHTNSLRHSQATFTPSPPIRELHTQAVLMAPIPPPKDYPHSRSLSFVRNVEPMGVEQLVINTQRANRAATSVEAQPGFSASPATSFFPSQPESPTPINGIHSGILPNNYAQTNDFNGRAATYPQTELGTSYPQNQAQYPHHSFSLGDTSSSHLPTPPLTQSQYDPAAYISTPTGSSQQYQNVFAQASQSASQSASSPASQLASSPNKNYLLGAMKKIHALAGQFQSQLQPPKPPLQTSNGGESFQQLLAAYQQQQQQQTNQLLAALQQQQQQPSPAFDPSQILAQYQQQNQNFLNTLAQMQANNGPALDPTLYTGQSTDYMNMLAQMQSSAPSADLSSLIGGGGGIDWTSVAGATGGVDPNTLAEAFATQSSGLF